MAATDLPSVELSSQPLSLSFRSVVGGGGGGPGSSGSSSSSSSNSNTLGGRHFVACGLADGTVEVHDVTGLVDRRRRERGRRRGRAGRRGGGDGDDEKDGGGDDDDDGEDEDDTIVSSSPVHSSEVPSRPWSSSSSAAEGKPEKEGGGGSSALLRGPSCRAVLFSNDDSNDAPSSSSSSSSVLFTAGNGGGIACLDSDRMCSFSGGMDDDDDGPSPLWYIPDAHVRGGAANGRDAGINRLHQLPAGCRAGPLLVSGDDGGRVRLWDARLCGNGKGGNGGSSSSSSSLNRKKRSRDGGPPLLSPLPRGCVAEWSHHTDYISGFDSSLDDGTTLLVSSADGTVSILDVRRPGTPVRDLPPHPARARTFANKMPGDDGTDPTLLGRSDHQEDELLSVCALKGGRKVACGTAGGVLGIWSYGTWGDTSDRFPGHPAGVDALLRVDGSTLLTGSGDGLIRAVSIQPDRLLGVLGNCGGLPVEAMAFGAGEERGGGVRTPGVLGAIGHDDVVRLWDAGVLFDDDDDEDEDEDEEDSDDSSDDADGNNGGVVKNGGSREGNGAKVAAGASKGGSDDEWEDADDSSDDDDDGKKDKAGNTKDSDDSDNSDSDSDDSDDSGGGGGGWGNRRGRPKLKTEAEQFFEDL